MMTLSNISGFLSTAEAAAILGSTAHHIARLARDGEIASFKTVGNALLIDAASFHTYMQISKGKGRPLSTEMAFAALWELSGLDAPWLAYAQKRRLQSRLVAATAEDLVWSTRKRAVERKYRTSTSFFPRVKEHLILSGRSIEAANSFGLVNGENVVEGYVHANTLESLVRACFLEEDLHGNVIVHTANWLPDSAERIMPEAVSAVDLAASLDTRERSAGLGKLRELIDEYANASGY